MIKKLIQRLLGKDDAAAPAVAVAAAPADPVPAAPPPGRRVEIGAAEHGIDPLRVDAHAARVVRTLQDAGHEAYIVGGAVRDLLVGLRPKDFDVATDATPEQVKSLFRRAFIIGRRFRLVHVVFGRGREHETIEVSTFRAHLDAAAAEQLPGDQKGTRGQLADKTHVVDAAGRVLRDNVWGPQVDDAARRDFTVNAMYYDPVTQTVVDYHGGWPDTRARLLRMIGDAEARYREDPVRIVRVVRFAAKLGFALEPATERPLRAMAALLANVPASRLFDETVKLLQTGHAIASVAQLRRFGLVGPGGAGVFPVLDAAFGGAAEDPGADAREAFVRAALEDTDRRVAEDRPVAPSFLLACLLWHDVRARWAALRAAGEPPMPALQQAIDAVFDARIGDISGRGKLAADMREIWLMQPRLERRTAASAAALVEQARFRAGYDFLRLRTGNGELGDGGGALADWWEALHRADSVDRQAMLDDLRLAAGARGRGDRAEAPHRDGVRPQGGDGRDADADADDDDDGAGDDAAAAAPLDDAAGDAAPARKRRRRRRKSAGARGPDAAPGG